MLTISLLVEATFNEYSFSQELFIESVKKQKLINIFTRKLCKKNSGNVESF